MVVTLVLVAAVVVVLVVVVVVMAVVAWLATGICRPCGGCQIGTAFHVLRTCSFKVDERGFFLHKKTHNIGYGSTGRWY